MSQTSLKNNPNLKKVIIVKSLPRYDPHHTDPNSIKSNLNQFGNSIYNNLWMESGCPANIQIVDQHMDCQGPLREKRFGNPAQIGFDGKKWDGCHMRGRLAVPHFTNSYVRILSEFSPLKNNWTTKDKQRSEDYRQSDNYQPQPARHGYRRRHSRNHHSQKWSGHQAGQDSQYGYQQSQEYVRVSNRFENMGNY